MTDRREDTVHRILLSNIPYTRTKKRGNSTYKYRHDTTRHDTKNVHCLPVLLFSLFSRSLLGIILSILLLFYHESHIESEHLIHHLVIERFVGWGNSNYYTITIRSLFWDTAIYIYIYIYIYIFNRIIIHLCDFRHFYDPPVLLLLLLLVVVVRYYYYCSISNSNLSSIEIEVRRGSRIILRICQCVLFFVW